MPRHAEFANDEDVERRAERFRDFEADWHAAARKRQHESITAMSEPAVQFGAEETSGFDAFAEWLIGHRLLAAGGMAAAAIAACRFSTLAGIGTVAVVADFAAGTVARWVIAFRVLH
jgi:hypothetical protein